MKLTMVGTGYVGLVTGACLASTGNRVTCLDIDRKKIDALNCGQCPIFEPGLQTLIQRNAAAKRLSFTTDRDEAYLNADAIFICVGTPSDEDGSADLQHVLGAARDIAGALEKMPADAPPKLIVVKSTVPVGSTHAVERTIREHTTRPFMVANNPEFLKEGAAVSDFMKPDRVVCGVEEEAAAELLRELYEPFVRQGNPILMMDIRSSEMVKYASNAFLACKISFINEMAQLCELYGADIQFVRFGMCADTRIGKHFLYPGLGYGGSCFPKDTLAVISMGRAKGLECELNQSVHRVNQLQRRRFWDRVVEHFDGDVSGVRFAFWGASFKPETDDIREAPALFLMQQALDAGATVTAFDPAAAENLRAALPAVCIVESMYDAIDDADALVISTEWNEFRFPDFDEMAKRMRAKVIFDGRNIYRRKTMQELGFTYRCIGREPVKPDAGANAAAAKAATPPTTDGRAAAAGAAARRSPEG